MKFNKKKERIIVIPDSFKGNISSVEVCQIMTKSIKKFLPDIEVISIPIADGGEGTVVAFLQAVGGDLVNLPVEGPLRESIDSFYGVLEDETVVIEIAAAAGLPLLEVPRVMETSTYGVGQLISHALSQGKRKIIIGLGGSSTNDGGAGACAALGYKFFDKKGQEFVPVGKNLINIDKIESLQKHPALAEAKIILMSDVNNPLCGKLGAANVFGPQKGANQAEIKLLDEGLRNFARLIKRDIGVEIVDKPGAGAAGGMGGGLSALLDAQLKMGIEVILETIQFDKLLEKTSLVFTGEGKLDAQTLSGKAISGIARHTKKFDIPLIAVVGDISDHIDKAYNIGVTAIFSTNRLAIPYELARKRSKSDLALVMDEIMRILIL